MGRVLEQRPVHLPSFFWDPLPYILEPLYNGFLHYWTLSLDPSLQCFTYMPMMHPIDVGVYQMLFLEDIVMDNYVWYW